MVQPKVTWESRRQSSIEMHTHQHDQANPSLRLSPPGDARFWPVTMKTVTVLFGKKKQHKYLIDLLNVNNLQYC